MSVARQEAFNNFKRTYSHNQTFHEQKQALKEKYVLSTATNMISSHSLCRFDTMLVPFYHLACVISSHCLCHFVTCLFNFTTLLCHFIILLVPFCHLLVQFYHIALLFHHIACAILSLACAILPRCFIISSHCLCHFVTLPVPVCHIVHLHCPIVYV